MCIEKKSQTLPNLFTAGTMFTLGGVCFGLILDEVFSAMTDGAKIAIGIAGVVFIVFGLLAARYPRLSGKYSAFGLSFALALVALAAFITLTAPIPNVIVADDKKRPDWLEITCAGPITGRGPNLDEYFVVLIGSNVFYFRDFPVTPLSFQSDTLIDNTITLNRGEKDSLLVTAKIRSSESDHVIANIDENRWIEPSEGVVRWYDNQHRMRVVDQADDLVLEIHFWNANTIRITGVFSHPGFPQAIVDDHGMVVKLKPHHTEHQWQRIDANCLRGGFVIGPSGFMGTR